MHRISKLIKVILMMTFLFSNSALAAETSPYKVLEQVGSNLFTRIAANQKEIQQFPEVMRDIVDEELMPSIDYKYVAYRILGKNLKKVTKEQRAKFVDAMRFYLIRTYAVALMQYKNQDVIFERDKDVTGKKIVSVNARIVDMNAPTINLIFKMRKNKKTQQWKTFDMVVEGISLLSSKKAELTKRIGKLGIDQVSLELASIAK